MSLPMLADFSIRLAGGLAAVLATAPWRVVPPQFFRTHCQVMLGLGVLATLVTAGPSMDGWMFSLSLAVTILAFLGSVLWGLGLPTIALPVTVLTASASAALLCITADGSTPALWAINAASRLASSFLLGSTLTAMLLGHYYLTAPAMSIDPLRKFVKFMVSGLAIRTALATVVAIILWRGELGGVAVGEQISPLFLAMRWGMGIAGAGVATYLTWETVKIRSTQSATGILYIAMTLLLFGELSSLILARESHVLI